MTQKRQQLGQATQIDVLNAQKSLQSLQSTLTQTKAGLQTQHQQLCVQTGWTYDAEPDIQDLPQADLGRIAAMNLAADTQTALQQNLSLQSNKRGYANMAEGSADKKNMDRTIKNQEQTIRSSMQTLYNDIMQKQTALQLADASRGSRDAGDECDAEEAGAWHGDSDGVQERGSLRTGKADR